MFHWTSLQLIVMADLKFCICKGVLGFDQVSFIIISSVLHKKARIIHVKNLRICEIKFDSF